MSLLWPKIDPVNFDESKMTAEERAGLLDAYAALLLNPAFKLVIQETKDTVVKLKDIDYCSSYGLTAEQSQVLRNALLPIANLEDVVKQALMSFQEENNGS